MKVVIQIRKFVSSSSAMSCGQRCLLIVLKFGSFAPKGCTCGMHVYNRHFFAHLVVGRKKMPNLNPHKKFWLYTCM